MGFWQNLGWEMGFGTPLQDPLIFTIAYYSKLGICFLPKRVGRCNLVWSQNRCWRLANGCDCLDHTMEYRCQLGRSCRTRSWVRGSSVIRMLFGPELSYF